MPKQTKSAKTQQNQEQQETQTKYIRSSKIEEIEKKCSDYKKIQEQIQELGFPVNPASDQFIKEIIEKQDEVQLGKYLASHYWGKQSDLLTKINEKLVEHGFQVTDDLQCEQIITININNNNIGKKYDYKKLFELKDTACPSQLLSVDHYSSEIITKFVEPTDNPELLQLLTIRKNIQDLLNKLDKIRIFSNKLSNIKSQSAEDKLLKQFDNLEKDYYLVKNTQFNFDKLSQQKKTKTSKKKGNPNEGDNNQEDKDHNQDEQGQKDNDQPDHNQLNTNQEEQKQSNKGKQKKSKQSKPKNKEQAPENQDGEQNAEKPQNKKEKKAKKSEAKQEKITENQEEVKQSKIKVKKTGDQQSSTKKETKPKIKKTNTSQQVQEDPKQKKLDQFFKKKTQ
ncbi:unnamed protein product (macronuclear) [Paramecium tetraurelia]|uniref:Uncharacterized protein n=1 Tax=Paramecium tetraurelia TaxID=5888 RepID=A0CQQ7_PARTE|nr:uncharacterized protein GSPATT00009472001 [Paramecium tetraurelia]CAK73124.1 unnamed protein product [Paramecium tetraurelia]|eukprot:XP_001440521.1 hypothetical protein (macronuclear) [Paramecium tetraurelia strain d4-2]